ncbi:MAG: glycosyltransferase, partial [Bacteroidota bacterium]
MKIAVWHNLNSGGGKRALYNHVKGLVQRGHQVVSFCPDTADQNYLPLSSIIEERIYPLKEKLRRRIKTIKYLNSYSHIKEKLSALYEHSRECAADINNGGFDILFANSNVIFFMPHIGRYVSIPKAVYLGEPYRPIYEAYPEFLWKAPEWSPFSPAKYLAKRLIHVYKMNYYSLLAREELKSAKSYNTILVNSVYSRESVMRAYRLDAKVCYLGIDTSLFKKIETPKEQFILGVGAFV